MTLPVHHCPDLGADPQVGQVIRLEGDEAHHAVAVRRLRVGESVRLVDGEGLGVTGPIVGTGTRVLEVEVAEVRREPPPRPEITVVQALPKAERGELAVEVLTEIGVDVIIPWAARRSVAVWRGERGRRAQQKWATTALQAAKQARRPRFPRVAPLATTAEVVGGWGGADLVLVLHEEASERIEAVLADATAERLPERIALIVGPEGGIDPDELDAFAAAGARSVRLGREVLRTSTAGVAAGAVLMDRTGRWR